MSRIRSISGMSVEQLSYPTLIPIEKHPQKVTIDLVHAIRLGLVKPIREIELEHRTLPRSPRTTVHTGWLLTLRLEAVEKEGESPCKKKEKEEGDPRKEKKEGKRKKEWGKGT
jgi:hypothetical protein